MKMSYYTKYEKWIAIEIWRMLYRNKMFNTVWQVQNEANVSWNKGKNKKQKKKFAEIFRWALNYNLNVIEDSLFFCLMAHYPTKKGIKKTWSNLTSESMVPVAMPLFLVN